MVQNRTCKQKFSIQIACKNSQCEYVIMMPDISLVNLKNRSLQKNRQCERAIITKIVSPTADGADHDEDAYINSGLIY